MTSLLQTSRPKKSIEFHPARRETFLRAWTERIFSFSAQMRPGSSPPRTILKRRARWIFGGYTSDRWELQRKVETAPDIRIAETRCDVFFLPSLEGQTLLAPGPAKKRPYLIGKISQEHRSTADIDGCMNWTGPIRSDMPGKLMRNGPTGAGLLYLALLHS